MMNILKRALGIVWIALGPLVLFLLVRSGASDMARHPGTETTIQWSVFILVFIPMALGLVFFGYYSLKGEYDGEAHSADSAA